VTVSAANEYRDMIPGKVVRFSKAEDLEIAEILQQQGGIVDGTDNYDWATTAQELVSGGKLGAEKNGSMIQRRAGDLQRILGWT